MAAATHKEEKLVALLKGQDKKGLEILYERYAAALYGVVFRIVGSQTLAEDVLQESFVKIWQKIDHYDASKGRLFTWILNIARNSAIDLTRSKSYKQSGKVLEIDYSVYEKAGMSMNTDQIGLKEIINRLKPEHKNIIDLVYFNGYTQAEVAEELNIPLGTVKTRLKIAMKQLRAIFQ